jgi:uncharacterized protein YkwD
MQRYLRHPGVIMAIAVALVAQIGVIVLVVQNHGASAATHPRQGSVTSLASATATATATLTPTVTPKPTLTPIPTSLASDFITRVIARTNMYRAKYAPQCVQLTYNAQLTLSAFRHSEDMAIHGTLNHTGSDGSSPPQRMSAAGYHYLTWAENIGWYFSSPEEVVDKWFDEVPPDDGHRLNILSCTLHQIGVGVYYTAVGTGPVQSHYYWTQDFGTPA